MLRKRTKDADKLSVLQRIGLYFYNKKETTLVFWIAIVIFGIVSYTVLLPREGFPNVSIPISAVSGTYLVNDKAVVDEKLAKPIGEIIKKVDGVKKVTTEAGDNFFVMIVTYEDGITSETGNALVKQAVQEAKIVPQNATLDYKSVNGSQFAEQSDILVSVFAKDASTEKLATYADNLAKSLSSVSVVKDASYIRQFETGTNPLTGKTVTVQRSFDITASESHESDVHLFPSAIVGVRSTADADSFAIYDGVQEKLTELKNTPEYKNVDFLIVADFAEGVRAQISSLQQSLLEGLIVVIAISFLLISWRAGLATVLSMVTVLLATIGLLYATGNTLNTIVLFALILSLGLIVDDTIIMVEAIDAERSSKLTKQQAVAMAIKRVARASFAGTLVTMLAFAPMLFIGGILGDFIRVLPITIILALAMSLLMSLTLVPFFARFLITDKKKKHNVIAKFETKVSERLAGLVSATKGSKKRKIWTTLAALTISLGFFFGSLVYFSKLKFDIFPTTKDSDTLIVTITTPPQTTIESAQAITMEAADVVHDTVGENFKRLTLQNTGSQTGATATVELISMKKRDITSQQIIAELENSFANFKKADIRVSQADAGPGKEVFPFKARVFGDDTTKTLALAKDIEKYLSGREILRANGTKSAINRVELRNESVKREDGNRYVEVQANFTDSDVSALVLQAERQVRDEFNDAKIESYGLSADSLQFDFGSESQNQDSFKTMLIAFPILLIVMFVLLAFQFRSLIQPLLIFIAIPFSFFGVAAGLYYTHNPLSFFVMIGFFALIGIALNNTILLTDYANQARKAGSSPTDAMALAIKARFRPLLATSLTSVVALIPLALSDPFWESLAYTLIFGLLSSTFLVIVSFPYMYLIVEWLRMLPKRLRAKK